MAGLKLCSRLQPVDASQMKKIVDYAWRPVADQKLLEFLGSVAWKKRGWFPYVNGHALVSHRPRPSVVLILSTR